MKHIQTLMYLQTFHHNLLESDYADLTHRQTLILLTIYLDKHCRTVRSLAQQLAISKPAISRSLDKLEGLGFVLRSEDQDDLRSINILPTINGGRFLTYYASLAASSLQKALGQSSLPPA